MQSLKIQFYSSMSGSRTVDKITSQLDQEEKLMFVHEKNGNYAQAEKNRLRIEQLRKDLELRTLYQMEQRHRREQAELERTNSSQFAAFNLLMDQRVTEIQQDGEKVQRQLIGKQKQEYDSTRRELQVKLSPEVKESSELLNLRTMGGHMVRQHNFAEAHKVQQQIIEREKVEKAEWLARREERIDTALATLKAKHNVQMANLKKRYKTLLDQLLTERKIQQERLLQKHQNFRKDLKSQQQKEVINYKGEFKSKGGRDSPLRQKSLILA